MSEENTKTGQLASNAVIMRQLGYLTSLTGQLLEIQSRIVQLLTRIPAEDFSEAVEGTAQNRSTEEALVLAKDILDVRKAFEESERSTFPE